LSIDRLATKFPRRSRRIDHLEKWMNLEQPPDARSWRHGRHGTWVAQIPIKAMNQVGRCHRGPKPPATTCRHVASRSLTPWSQGDRGP
jgi:hypothetical protein